MGTELAACTSLDVQQYLSGLSQRLKPIRIHEHFRVLKTFFTWCIETELLRTHRGGLIGGFITWAVTHFYSRRQEKVIAHLPERIVREFLQRGLIVPEREAEARTVARRALVSWATSDASQAEMNQASYRDFEKADLGLRHSYERLRMILEPKDLERLDQAQEAWRSFRDEQVRFAGGFYEGGSIRPLIHNVEALVLTETRIKELERLYDEIRSR